VIVADREIGEDGIMSQNMVCFGSGGGRFRMSPNYLHSLAQRQYSADFDSSTLPQAMAEVDREEQGLKSMGFGEVVDSISSGRVRLSILLDTSGGTLIYRRYLEMIQWYLERTGGDFSVYGGEGIQSLGALIMAMPPRKQRFAHRHSKIRFHLPQGGPNSPRLEREDIQELQSLLMGLVGAGNRRKMRSLLAKTLLAENPASPDRRVEFYGKFAEELGILNTMGGAQMRNHFLQSHGLSEGSIAGTSIAQFFDRLMAYEKDVREAFRGLMQKWKTNRIEQ
jgi:hypothetical protein